MPIRNKFRAYCSGCGREVPVLEGLSEKKETLGIPGDGWLTKHMQCDFVPPKPVRTIPWRRHETELTPIYDEFDEFNITMGMTESEFFGGDLGDKH